MHSMTSPLTKPEQQETREQRREALYSLVVKATQDRTMTKNRKGATTCSSRYQAVQTALHLPIFWAVKTPEQQHLRPMPGAPFSCQQQLLRLQRRGHLYWHYQQTLAAVCRAPLMPCNIS